MKRFVGTSLDVSGVAGSPTLILSANGRAAISAFLTSPDGARILDAHVAAAPRRPSNANEVQALPVALLKFARAMKTAADELYHDLRDAHVDSSKEDTSDEEEDDMFAMFKRPFAEEPTAVPTDGLNEVPAPALMPAAPPQSPFGRSVLGPRAREDDFLPLPTLPTLVTSFNYPSVGFSTPVRPHAHRPTGFSTPRRLRPMPMTAANAHDGCKGTMDQ
jgi:hypothetical protein